MHTYPAFARDHTISLAARGILASLVLDESHTVDELAALSPDSREDITDWLIELKGAGYATEQTPPGRNEAVWVPTKKAEIRKPQQA